MRLGGLALTALLSATAVSAAGRSLRHAGKQFEERMKRDARTVAEEQTYRQYVERDEPAAPLFLNENTKSE